MERNSVRWKLEMWVSPKRNIIIFLVLVNIAILGFVGALYLKGVSKGAFLPVTQDECTYYNSARIFGETGSVKAVTCLNGERSIIANTHWYGPAYHVLYGSLCKLFGLNEIRFIHIHLVFLLISVGVIFLFAWDVKRKLIFLTIFLSSYASFSYAFTYFPETIVITFTLLLLLLYTKVRDKRTFAIFAISILLVSIFRVTAVLWVCTFPFLEYSGIKRTRRILYAAISIIIVFLYMRYFTAPAFAKGISSLHGTSNELSFIDRIMGIVHNFMSNLKIIHNYLFYHEFGIMSILSLVLIYIFAVNSITRETEVETRNFAFGVLLMATVTILVFMTLYTFSMIYIEKQLAFLLPPLIYVCILLRKNVAILVMVSLLIFLPFSYSKARKNIEVRRESYNSVKPYANEIKEFTKFIQFVNNSDKEIRIAFNLYEYHVPNYMILFYLPVSKKGVPVTYMNTVCEENSDIVQILGQYETAKYDYLISRREYDYPFLKSIYENTSVTLYQRR